MPNLFEITRLASFVTSALELAQAAPNEDDQDEMIMLALVRSKAVANMLTDHVIARNDANAARILNG